MMMDLGVPGAGGVDEAEAARRRRGRGARATVMVLVVVLERMQTSGRCSGC